MERDYLEGSDLLVELVDGGLQAGDLILVGETVTLVPLDGHPEPCQDLDWVNESGTYPLDEVLLEVLHLGDVLHCVLEFV